MCIIVKQTAIRIAIKSTSLNPEKTSSQNSPSSQISGENASAAQYCQLVKFPNMAHKNKHVIGFIFKNHSVLPLPFLNGALMMKYSACTKPSQACPHARVKGGIMWYAVPNVVSDTFRTRAFVLSVMPNFETQNLGQFDIQ